MNKSKTLESFNRISSDVQLGKDVKLSCFINAYGCIIGDNSKIGSFVEIQKGAYIGQYCKISSHSFICEGVRLEDRCFVGHSVVFTNDKYPRSTNSDGSLQTEEDWTLVKTQVDAGVSIGSGSTILCGISIGRNSIIGAGSVVTKSIPPGEIWAGSPAKFFRKI